MEDLVAMNIVESRTNLSIAEAQSMFITDLSTDALSMINHASVVRALMTKIIMGACL